MSKSQKPRHRHRFLATSVIVSSLILAGCAGDREKDPQDEFFQNLLGLCGQAYKGALVSEDEADAGTPWATQEMVMYVEVCDAEEIRIPLHVGEDRSRTWIITRSEGGLQLKHDHRHEDGSPDDVTWYGGETAAEGTANRQEFPADQYSKDLFVEQGLDVSVANIWAVEVEPDDMFAYELSRPGRFFRAEFYLGETVAPPPPAWGDE